MPLFEALQDKFLLLGKPLSACKLESVKGREIGLKNLDLFFVWSKTSFFGLDFAKSWDLQCAIKPKIYVYCPKYIGNILDMESN